MNFTLEKLSEARNAGIPDDVIWRTAIKADERFAQAKEKNIPLESAFRAFQKSQAAKPAEPEPEQPFFALEDAVSAIGTIPEALAVGVPAAFKRLVTGTAMPEESETIERDLEFQERMQREQEDRQAAGKSSVVGEAIRGAAVSGPSTVIGLGSAIGGGAAGLLGGPAAKVTVPAGAMAASGIASYRMASADLLYRSFRELEKSKGSPLTDEEKAKAYEVFLPLAQESGLWEAGPEAVSNVLLAGAGKFIFGFGKPVADKIVKDSIGRVTNQLGKKIAAGTGALAGELAGETTTAVGQFPAQAKAEQFIRTGTTEGAPTEYPGGVVQAFKDVAPSTIALTAGLGLVGGGAKLTTMPFQRQKSPEQIEEDNINLDAEREADNLLIPDNDAESKSIKAQIDSERADLVVKKELYNSLPEGDKAKAVLATEIKEYEGRITELDNTLRQRLGLSVTITPVEQRQIELAKQIAAPVEPAPTTPAPLPEAAPAPITPAEEAKPKAPPKYSPEGLAALTDAELASEEQSLALSVNREAVTDPQSELASLYQGALDLVRAEKSRREAATVTETPAVTPAPVSETITPEPTAEVAPAPIVKQSKKRKGILGEQYINKDWTSLTKDELPQLNRELYNYYDWAKTIVDKLIPNANDFEKKALIMELRNEITEETAKPEFKDREQYILAQKVAGELITGKRRKILQRAKERAMGDEYAAWEMGGRFEESPISVEAFDSNAKGRPLPEGYTKQGDVYVYQAPAAPVSETITPAVEAAPVTPAPTPVTTPPVTEAVTPAPAAPTPAAPEVAPAQRDMTKPEQMTPDEAIDDALRKAEISPTETGFMAERDRGIVGSNAEEIHYVAVSSAIESLNPVSAEAVESYNITLPKGYTKQGELYVYQPAATATTPAPAEAAPAIKRMAAPVRVEEKVQPVPEADRYTFDEAGIRSIEFFGGKAPDGLLIVNDTTNPNYEMKAGYDPETGDIILNRAYIKKGESIEDILTHELGHYIFSDPKFQADFKNFLESMPDDTRADIEAIINESYNEETGQTQIEERQVMAFTALVKANKDTLSKWETIKNTIKRWINKIFGTKIKLSDEGAMAVFNVGFKRFKSGERIIRAMEEGTLRTAPEGMNQMDRDYLAAVERGDMETAQRMVDEAAKKAGYDVGPVYHGTNSERQNKYGKLQQGSILSSDAGDGGRLLGGNGNVAKSRRPPFSEFTAKEGIIWATENKKSAERLGMASDTPADFVFSLYAKTGDQAETWPDFQRGKGDSVRMTDGTWAFRNPNQIKSADPVTYDDAGNVIPLSQRFQPTQTDIRRMAAEPTKKITDPATPEEQTQQQVKAAQEQESIVDSAVKEAGATVFDVFNRLVNEGKTEEQVSQDLGISKFEVRKLKLRADTAILKKMKQKKVQPLAFQPKNPVVDFAEKNAKKYFTKEGWLPKMVYQSWVKRNAALSREQKEAEYAIKDLYDGIRKVFGISKMEMITKGLVSVPPDFVQQLNDALAGQIDINTMPEPVREPLTRMRQHIDTMSRQLVDLNVLPDDLAAKISDNLGVYLTRSYKIFTDKNWINKIPQEKLNNARNFLYKQQLKSDPTATIEMADRELRNMLNDWASEAEGLRKRGGKLGAKDLSVMMKRSEVPKVLREVMGENMNVVFNYANTIGKISRFLADQRFLNEVKAKGTGQFLFTAADAPKGFNTQIAAEESRTMSPLNGLRTTPEIAKAFEEFGKGYDAKENPFLYALGWMNAVGKLNLTVGSILTQMRNILGQPAFFVFNGHYNWAVIRQEVDAIAKEKGISKEDAKRELIKQAAAQGLVNENAYAGELRTAFQEVGLETFDDAGPDEFVKEFVLTRMFKQGVRSAQDLYQKTDEFGKLVGWLNETKRIQRMNRGMDKATAQSIAAERTRDTYPTYSQSSEALRLFRRQPFIGPFATFFYETFRTSFHNLRYAFEDMKGPTPEHRAEGRKRLAGAMAQLSAGAFAVNLISQALSNIGDDEEEDVRRMLPPWAKDASILWMPKSKDGTYNFINLSYINPYNALTDPFIAMMSGFAKGEKPEEIATQAFGSFLSPFVDEQPVSAAIVDAMRNRTETGKQVYNPQDDIATKTSKIMLHIFGKTFTPGTLARLNQRIIPAIEGETVGTRAPAPVREVTAELTGIRFETLDMKAAFSNKAWEFSKAANESERIFRDVATRRRRVNEQEQIDAYRRSEQTRYEIWNEMYRDYMAVRRAGASQSEAIRLMTDIGISKKEAQAIARGRYTPYEISDEVKRRSKLNGNTVPLTQIKAIGREMPKVLTDIAAE